jgi:hypothetical protein
LEGWGEVHGNEYFYGPWDEEETFIDELELTTVLLALQILPVLTNGANLRIFCDNTVAIAYINHMGGVVFIVSPVKSGNYLKNTTRSSPSPTRPPLPTSRTNIPVASNETQNDFLILKFS